MTNFTANYSIIDRWVHNLAMGQVDVQILVSRIEDRRFDREHAGIAATEPVFIASLPRAGTTLLLELLAGTPDFAAHTYRNMPFLLCPLTWDRLSRRFRRRAEVRERAHGDGMAVGYDSVEAFEEVLWRAFWPEHFERDRIRPWTPEEEDGEGAFAGFLRQHMRKIIELARRRGSERPRRYVSKNNASIARLGWLERRFPDATILIPYREPTAHVASLIRQHRNFLALHARDAFALRYMETLGHLEFGRALRPVDFDGWLAAARPLNPCAADFWAEYWIAAFRAVLQTAGRCAVVFSYDRLCAAPAAGLRTLERRLGLAGGLAAGAARIRASTAGPAVAIDAARLRRMEAIRAQLDARALF